MTMFLTRRPMDDGALDQALAAIGWVREDDEACDAADPRHAFISDIDVVPSADGERRIVFRGHRMEPCGTLLGAIDCIAEDDGEFWTILGLERQTEH